MKLLGVARLFTVACLSSCQPDDELLPHELVRKVDNAIIKEVLISPREIAPGVLSTPSASFHYPVGQPVSFDDNDRTYRSVVDHFKLLDGDSELEVSLVWNEIKDLVTLHPTATLPIETDLTLALRTHWEEKINGGWIAFSEADQSVVYEEKNQNFSIKHFSERAIIHSIRPANDAPVSIFTIPQATLNFAEESPIRMLKVIKEKKRTMMHRLQKTTMT